MEILRTPRTVEELNSFLSLQTDDYILEQYVLTRIAFEEDKRKRRYSEHAENVRACLKLAVLKKMTGVDVDSLDALAEEKKRSYLDGYKQGKFDALMDSLNEEDKMENKE